jgi:hypothetical protein
MAVNPMVSTVDPREIAEILKKFKYIISFVSTQIDETAEFADLIIPEAHVMNAGHLFLPIISQGVFPLVPALGLGRSGSRSWTPLLGLDIGLIS